MIKKTVITAPILMALVSCGGSGNSLNDTPDVTIQASQITSDTTPTPVDSLNQIDGSTMTQGQGVVIEFDETDPNAIANGTTITLLQANAYEDQDLYLVDLVGFGQPTGTMLLISDDIGAYLEDGTYFDPTDFDTTTVISGTDIGTLGYQVTVIDDTATDGTTTNYLTEFSISKPNDYSVVSVNTEAFVTSQGDITSSALNVTNQEQGFTAPTGSAIDYTGLMSLEYAPEGSQGKIYEGLANLIVNFDTLSGTLSANNLAAQTDAASVTGSFDVSNANGAMIGTSTTVIDGTTIQGGLLGAFNANGDVAAGIVGSSENNLFGVFGVSQ